jgi:hypothetical protein
MVGAPRSGRTREVTAGAPFTKRHPAATFLAKSPHMPGRHLGHRGPNTANNARSARAFAQAVELAPVIAMLQASGVTTLNGIAAELNARGIPTPQGGQRWHAAQVNRVLKRLAAVP